MKHRSRCLGIMVVTQGDRPLRRCAHAPVEGFPFCRKCNDRPVRQAILAAILRPHWQRDMECIVAGEEPPDVVGAELRSPTAIEAEAVREELQWWNRA